MNKNHFFEKVGKLTFSIILTGVLVTGIVIAAGATWDTYKDNDVITGTEWLKMVTSIKNKVNSSDLLQYYTKTESDKKFLTEVNIPTIVMDYGEFQGLSSANNKVNKPTCSSGYTPKIQVNLDWYKTVGDVDDNDLIGTRSTDQGAYWYIGGGDYDCGKLSGTKIIKGCGYNQTSKISYTAYCSSVPKIMPVCGITTNTCSVGSPSNTIYGTWTCTSGSVSISCGEFQDPCDRPNPPRYCDGSEHIPE